MMSKRKKKQTDTSPASAAPPVSVNPESAFRQLDFDALEDKIRGEEIMMNQDLKKAKDARDFKKKVMETEVDKKLERLRKQLGLKK